MYCPWRYITCSPVGTPCPVLGGGTPSCMGCTPCPVLAGYPSRTWNRTWTGPVTGLGGTPSQKGPGAWEAEAGIPPLLLTDTLLWKQYLPVILRTWAVMIFTFVRCEIYIGSWIWLKYGDDRRRSFFRHQRTILLVANHTLALEFIYFFKSSFLFIFHQLHLRIIFIFHKYAVVRRRNKKIKKHACWVTGLLSQRVRVDRPCFLTNSALISTN